MPGKKRDREEVSVADEVVHAIEIDTDTECESDDEQHLLYEAYMAARAAEIAKLWKEEREIAACSPLERLQRRRLWYRCGPKGFAALDKENERWKRLKPQQPPAHLLSTRWPEEAKQLSIDAALARKRMTRDTASPPILDDEDEPTNLSASDIGVDPSYDCLRRFPVSPALNERLVLWKGDITSLEVGAIVNAAKHSLMGGGGIDGAIHAAAGPLLREDCARVVAETGGPCPTGETRMTKGFNLPAGYVLHTVGPIGYGDEELHSCYETVLNTIKSHNLKVLKNSRDETKKQQKKHSTCLDNRDEEPITSVALCCISTGIFGFPLVRAAHIAIRCVREWLEKNETSHIPVIDAAKEVENADDKGETTDVTKMRFGGIESVIFCCFTEKEHEVYKLLLPSYFPIERFPRRAAVTLKEKYVVPLGHHHQRGSSRKKII